MRTMLNLNNPHLTKGDDWRDLSSCREVDPELFFPLLESQEAKAQEQAAKRICLDCPVVNECLTWAMDNRHEYGIWGGLSEEERRRLRYARTGVKVAKKFR